MLPLVGWMLCWCLCYMIKFKFQQGFNLAFVYLMIFFSSFVLLFIPFQEPVVHFCEALHLSYAVMKRRQFNLVAASPPGMWAMLVQIQAESKSIPVQLVPVRWSQVFQPPGRKHLLLFEAVGVKCLIQWQKGRNPFATDPPGSDLTYAAAHFSNVGTRLFHY